MWHISKNVLVENGFLANLDEMHIARMILVGNFLFRKLNWDSWRRIVEFLCRLDRALFSAFYGAVWKRKTTEKKKKESDLYEWDPVAFEI